MTEDELTEIAHRASAARSGPWVSYVEGRDHHGGAGVPIADQDFIASARQDIPRLVAEIRRLRKVVETG